MCKSTSVLYTSNEDPCFSYVSYSPHTVYYYIDGLGHYYFGDATPNQNHRLLEYYKKGSEEWGTPINFDYLMSVEAKYQKSIATTVYPNPFTDFTILKLNNNLKGEYQLDLIDVYGNIVKDRKSVV